MTTRRVDFPRSAVEAAQLLQRHHSVGHTTMVIGGGTLTIPSLSHGYATPSRIIDLGRIDAREIRASASEIHVGALVAYQQLIVSPTVRRELRLLHLMASGITGGIQIRNQGTLGGAGCAARPHSDAPAVLVALDAQMIVQSAAAQRVVAAADFFVGAESNDMSKSEVLSGISFPRRFGTMRAAYYKLKFAESSWPVVTASCLLPPADVDGSGTAGRLVVGGLATVPLVIPIEANEGTFDEDTAIAQVRAAIGCVPSGDLWSDLRASADYRCRVAPEIARRALRTALTTPGGTR
ncbi:FAD binding domain-containing protein [Rhodococcus sp. P1Y]|uniref:FAD binding domain-containing protein n=1 Tax=Rhodococcus sp. P1Y TaxID=1302308 RepID=UPI000EB22772|nr:FAD binding domain-containing protein [Rhodococcus sp. P1Y]AYJ48820.1 carbon monoxide dehydrogenase [Rhodococcus sp. P1Y]